jgi:hypothetical protein
MPTPAAAVVVAPSWGEPGARTDAATDGTAQTGRTPDGVCFKPHHPQSQSYRSGMVPGKALLTRGTPPGPQATGRAIESVFCDA